MAEEKKATAEELARARLAMGGEKLAKKIADKKASATNKAEGAIRPFSSLTEEELEDKIRQAKIAMEGRERTKLREKREQEEREKMILAQKIEATKQKRLTESNEQEDKKLAEAEAVKRKAQAEETVAAQKREAAKALVEKIKQSQETTKGFRTLKTDFDQAITQKGLTQSQMALDEERRNRQERPARAKISNYRSIIIVVISLILISAGLTAGYLAWQATKTRDQVQPTAIDSVIFADHRQEIEITGKTPRELKLEIISLLNSSSLARESVTNVYFTKTEEVDGQLIKRRINFDEFLSAVDISLPEDFIRFIQPDFMMGIHHHETDTIFFVLETRSFKNSFATLLRVEATIIHNLLSPWDPDWSNQINQLGSFTDKIISNKDTRITEVNGKIQGLYSFLDSYQLVIAPSRETFEKIVDIVR